MSRLSKIRFVLTLRLQFVAYVCTLVAVLMMGVYVFTFSRERAVLEATVDDLGQSTTHILCSSFRDRGLQGEVSGRSGAPETFLLDSALSLERGTLPELTRRRIIDYGCLIGCGPDDRPFILASSEKDESLTPAADLYSKAAWERAVEGRVDGPFEVYRDGRRYREFISAIKAEPKAYRSVLRIGYDVGRRIDAVVAEMQRALLWMFLVALAAGAVLALLLSYVVVAPIRRLAQAAKTLAFGGRDKTVEVSSSVQEIRDLGDAMNYMREKIEAHISELDDANAALDRKVFELRTLFDVAETMNFKSYSPELLAYILDTAMRALDAEWGSLWLYNPEADRLEVTMVRGAGYERSDVPKLRPGEGIAGQVFESSVSIVSNEGSADPRWNKVPGQEAFESSVRQIICVPLLVDNEAIGVINVVNKKGAGTGFDDHDLHLLGALASQGARALEHAKLYDLAIRESKTGLYIPRYFEARLQEQVAMARRYSQTFSVLITDIDHFKLVNDRHGHLVGDVVLLKVSRFLKESLRENLDIASRWGGEEFAVILPKTDREGAMTYSERYRRRVERESPEPERGLPGVTVSVGVATFPTDGTEATALLKRADDALYQAKRSGRNRVVAATSA